MAASILGAARNLLLSYLIGGWRGLLTGIANVLRSEARPTFVRAAIFGGPPLWLRYGTVDPDVVVQIHLRGEYDVRPRGDVSLIIDGGAHIGVATRRLAQAFPAAKVIAVEPDPRNFELLSMNTAELANVECVNAAIMSASGPVTVIAGRENWLNTVEAGGSSPSVEGVTVGELMARASASRVDILKLDIEGTEFDLFAGGSPDWLESVGTLLIELHDWMRPGCSRNLYRATEDFEFEWRVGEIVGLSRERPLEVRAAVAIGTR